MVRFLFGIFLFFTLTALTQIGGVIWLISRLFTRGKWMAFFALYSLTLILNTQFAPQFGRVPLPCIGEPLRERSVIFCLLNRNYVVPEMRDMLEAYAQDANAQYPDTVTYSLDGSFPYSTMPLLPHLSHRDGKKIDLAFYYVKDAKPTNKTRSPLAYFAFEYPRAPNQETCPKAWPSLRWDLRWLQWAWRDYEIDDQRMRYMLNWFQTHQAQYGIDKIFVEPHLRERWGAQSNIFRFQGCRAARHDDHVHIQIK